MSCTSSSSRASPPTATSRPRSRPPSGSARTAAATRAAAAGRNRRVAGGIVTALAPGPALLVLDNCEHVVRSAADLVHALVSLTEELRVLTTSRAPLGLSSESVYLLPELDLATTAELFRQRARAVRPDADLPADAVRELCGRLGRAAARRGTGRREGPGHVGGRDRPPPRRPVRGAARRRKGRAAAPPHAGCRDRLELEPPRPGRPGGDARVVGVPRRVHRRRRPAPARRRASCRSSSSSPISRCSRSPTPRRAPGTGCWRPSGSSPPRTAMTPARPSA